MRCTNCGWDNSENAQLCIKCNTNIEKTKPEQKKAISEVKYNKTVSDSEMESDYREKSGERQGKIYEHTVPDVESANAKLKDELIDCSNCGYSNPGDAKVCAKCQSPLHVERVSEKKIIPESKLEETLPVEISSANANVSKSFKGTIDPYRKVPIIENTCRLTLVLREGEKKPNPMGFHTFLDRNFSSQNTSVELKRANLEEENSTITSKVQAELFFENGKWYLLDKSELQTTFVRAGNKIELNEGDVILMGDRKFTFSTKENPKKYQTG